MSVTSELTRLQTARNTLRTKAVALGIGTSTDKLDDLADAFDGIVDRGAVTVSIQEGDTYTIQAGYHNGSGTVSAVAGGGNYSLQQKGPISPTTSQQTVSADTGYYGLSSVTIAPIPSNYADVSAVTAIASHVLANDVFVNSSGVTTAGTMTNNGAVSKTLDATANNQSYTVPTGYHNGSGTVSITLEEKSATPTESAQNITPTSGKVLSKVTVAAIPSKYKDTTNADAVAGDVLAGKTFINGTGEVEGTMPDRGTVSQVLDATTGKQSYTIPSGKHSGSGTVSIVLEEKSATPSGSSQNITPTNGKVLSKVTVAAIPAKYGDTSSDDAIAANILDGKYAHSYSNGAAVQLEGTMPNNGAVSGSIDGLTTTSYSIPLGYTSGGTVSLTNDIESALAAI